MEERILIPVEASLTNPTDPSEITLVADAASVGMTKKTGTGHIINWTSEILRSKANTLIGKPVNVMLADGKATSHSRNVIGTIIEASFDDTTQKLRIVASLWRHYFPETIAQLGDLFRKGKLQVSVEFGIAAANRSEGVTEPTDGMFMGLAIVDEGADPRNRVLVLASALKTDMEALNKLEDEEIAVLPMSFEWAGDQIAQYLADRNEEDATVTGTFNNGFVYQNGTGTYSVSTTLDNGNIVFSEPVIWQSDNTNPYQTIHWGVVPSQEHEEKTMEELAEVQASLVKAQAEASEYKEKFEKLQAEVAERDERDARAAADAAALVKATERLAEVEKISPYTDETLKTEHFELFKTADDVSFNAIKNLILATVTPKGGIASEGGLGPTEEEDNDPVLAEALKNLPAWREEIAALFKQPDIPNQE